jgi:hypothetical protein
MPAMYPETVQLFYDESKAARQGLDEVIRQYRTNTTAVVAFATGAATFFGLEFRWRPHATRAVLLAAVVRRSSRNDGPAVGPWLAARWCLVERPPEVWRAVGVDDDPADV